jgi:signal transduction histidine kinase
MPSPSHSANPSSTSSRTASARSPAVFLVAATVLAATIGAIGWGVNQAPLAAGGLIAATTLAGAFAVYLIVAERRRHETAEDALHAQATFLESLVASMAAVSAPFDADEIVTRTCEEAKSLFGAREARIVPPHEGTPGEAKVDGGRMLVPMAVRGEELGTLSLERSTPFRLWDLTRAQVLADLAARAVENTRLLLEAREREAERSRLTEQLITAEQDERRRLSVFLHDGPLQSMSGLAMIHDAALAAVREGRDDEAAKLMESSLNRERKTIQELRDLSFAIEPLVLRDQGFHAAVRALGDQIEQSQRITVMTDVDAGDALAEKAQAALYQIIRESLSQAVRRNPNRITITVEQDDGGGFVTEILDDGVGERRRASIEAIEERVRILNGRLTVDQGDEGGTSVRVVVPPYVATPGD